MTEEDPYKILGVSKNASQGDISKAYKKLAKKYHPDLNPGNKEAEARFKSINSAYEKIESPEKRKQYEEGRFDPFGAAGAGGGRSHQGPFYRDTQQGGGRYSFSFGGDFGGEDIFDQLFGGLGRGRAGRGGGPGPQEDRTGEQHFNLNLDFQDAVLGGEKEITLPNGKRLKVKIPPGVQSGTRLKLTGQGGQSASGTPASAYLILNVLPSSLFKRVGNDLELEVPIGFQEAILGGEVKIPSIDGHLLLKIPQGATTGMRLRARGKGVRTPSGERGDQINILKVEIPNQVDPELEAFMKNWKERHPFHPRPKDWGTI